MSTLETIFADLRSLRAQLDAVYQRSTDAEEQRRIAYAMNNLDGIETNEQWYREKRSRKE